MTTTMNDNTLNIVVATDVEFNARVCKHPLHSGVVVVEKSETHNNHTVAKEEVTKEHTHKLKLKTKRIQQQKTKQINKT